MTATITCIIPLISRYPLFLLYEEFPYSAMCFHT